VTGERQAYAYLGASIEKFPSGRAMCDLMESSGFIEMSAEPLSGGIVTIYSAQKRWRKLETGSPSPNPRFGDSA
jgi:demethylmenaquinone methyltransferase / 2-methoxy-6-polyprenyl-1,4-benzoquinol methylase